MNKDVNAKDTKCATLVDEKNNRLFCCVSVRDFEAKIHLCTSYK